MPEKGLIMHLGRFLILFLLLFSTPSLAGDEGQAISIVADEWCPFNCSLEAEKPGYVVELAKEIFAPYGIEVKYDILPWARALQGTEDGTYDAVIGVTKSESSKLIFPKEISGVSLYKFYVSTDSKWNYKNTNSLKDVTLGVIKDYGYGKLDKYINDHQNENSLVQILSSDDAASLNIKKLNAGRISATYGDEFVTEYTIKDLGLTGKIRQAGTINKTAVPKEDYIYLAFSPKNPKAAYYSKIYTDGIRKLRASGRLEEILQEYGLYDWAANKNQENR
jgi:polar amino acid transport system substrate-binding protein